MLKGQPSVLRLSAHTRQETVEATYTALTILSQRMERYRRAYEPNGDSLQFRLRSIRNDLSIFGNYVQLVIGRSQQPLLKGRMREWRVSAESRRIAAETGASFEDVYKLFMTLMSDYIRLREY